jgi:hypothetical protein
MWGRGRLEAYARDHAVIDRAPPGAVCPLVLDGDAIGSATASVLS